jgi:hypothetical protein
MLEESFLKTNFIGRDGFRWWIGQIPPIEAQGGQGNGAGWGNRVKVRILGYHPYSKADLADEDLPFAIALVGNCDGTGSGGSATSVKLKQGDMVFGFFLDGDNAQQPAILGAFGNTDQRPSTEPDGDNGFVPFTGFTNKVRPADGVIAPSESNEQNAASQKSPRSVSPKDAERINAGETDPRKKEIAASTVIGKKVTAASAAADSAVQNIKNDVQNFVERITEITKGITGGINSFVGNAKQSLMKEINSMTDSIAGGATRMVNDITKNVSKAIAPVFNKGLLSLYNTVYAVTLAATKSTAIAIKAGTAAQAAFISPIKAIFDAMPCVANQIINGISSVIKGVLKSVVDNVTNFVSCIADQVVGGLLNHITGAIGSFLGPLMGAVSKIAGGFDIASFLGKTANSMLGILSDLSCNATVPSSDLVSNEWVIGKGTTEQSGIAVDAILATANEAKSIASSLLNTAGGIINAAQDLAGSVGSLGVFDFTNPSVSQPGFKSALGNCYAGPPTLGGCGGTKIKIFGGKGLGGIAKAILGDLNTPIDGSRGLTGSLIGVDLVNGGGGYTFPPFVEIVDECQRGYGATARAVIDYDETSPTYQQIIDIYIVTEGENYTKSEDDVPGDYVVDDTIIVTPGENYDKDDVITDSDGQKYKINVDAAGRIIRVIRESVEEPASVDALLTYDIKSKTGSGAKLKPRFKARSINPQGPVKQVIDCI